jgi:ADP-ribosyltransferase exoenzyme
MPYPISANQHRDLISLINGTYLDQVDRITAAQVDDKDNIIAVAMDGKKKLAVKITDDNIAIRLMGGEPAANALKFAAPEKKPKNCSKGISCGASCIAASKTCKKKTTPTQKAQKTKIVKEAKVPKALELEDMDDLIAALPGKKIDPGLLEDLPGLEPAPAPPKAAKADIEESKLGTSKGQILRTPLQDLNKIPAYADPDVTDALAKTKKNVSPVFVKEVGKDEFDVVDDGIVAAAAKKAGLDFVWTVNVDDKMAKQLAIESKAGINFTAVGDRKDKPPLTSELDFGNPLGQILRQPVKFLQGKSTASPALIDELAAELKKSGKNVSPIYLHEDDKGTFKVVGNAHILEAARKAKLDFVQTVIVDKKMAEQLAIENGKKPAKSSKKDELADLSDTPTMIVEKAEKAIEQDKTKKEAIKQAVAKNKGSLATTPEEEVDGWPPSIKGKLSVKEEDLLLNEKFGILKDKKAGLMAAGLTEAEAIGFGSYIGSDYSEMNQLFWDKNAEANLGKYGQKEYLLAAAKNKAARDGMTKLKSFTLEELNNYSKSKNGEEYDGKRPLIHGMKNIDKKTAEAMYEQHKAVMDSGGTKLAGKFLSTSWQKDGNSAFMYKANVVIKVTPKTDGSGAGKMVDQYKTSMFESEVLYPPDTKFKVTKIVKLDKQPSKTVDSVETIDTAASLMLKDLQKLAAAGELKDSAWSFKSLYQELALNHGLPLDLSELKKSEYKEFANKLIEVSKKIPLTKEVSGLKYVPARAAGYEFHYQEI